MFIYKETQIDEHIGQVENDAGKLQDKIHALAVATILVWHDAKAVDRKDEAQVAAARLTRLQNASPYHADSFSQWVATVPSMEWAPKTKTWFVNIEKELRLMGKDFVTLRDIPFFTLVPAKTPKPFKNFEALEVWEAKSSKHNQKPVEGDVIDLELVREVRTAIANAKARAA